MVLVQYLPSGLRETKFGEDESEPTIKIAISVRVTARRERTSATPAIPLGQNFGKSAPDMSRRERELESRAINYL